MPRDKKRRPISLDEKRFERAIAYLAKERARMEFVRDKYGDHEAARRIRINTIKTFLRMLPQGRELLHQASHERGGIYAGKKKKNCPICNQSRIT